MLCGINPQNDTKLSMLNRLFSIAASLILLPLITGAQDVVPVWEPSFAYSWKQSDRLGFNSKTKIYSEFDDVNSVNTPKHIESQLSATYRTGIQTKTGIAYQYRNASPFAGNGHQYEHRLAEQFGFKSSVANYELSQRLRLEQRIKTDEFEQRLRYRLGTDIPLQGENLDVGESFLIIENEFMGTVSDQFEGAENRFLIGQGFLINEKSVFEISLQYRTTGLLEDGGSLGHVFLLGTGFTISR